jgi:uncharacterized membrane protein
MRDSLYRRVVPRDLFNEAKLLKCLGKIAIGILDGKLSQYGVEEDFSNENMGFVIDQNEDGGIFCLNYKIFKNKKEVQLFSGLNSKLNWPLMTIDHREEYIHVFDDDGNFSEDFIKFLKSKKKGR